MKKLDTDDQVADGETDPVMSQILRPQLCEPSEQTIEEWKKELAATKSVTCAHQVTQLKDVKL